MPAYVSIPTQASFFLSLSPARLKPRGENPAFSQANLGLPKVSPAVAVALHERGEVASGVRCFGGRDRGRKVHVPVSR